MVRTFRRPLVLLVFVLLAGAGSAQALPTVEGSREAQCQNPLVFAWDWMASLLEKAGSFIDPDGDSVNPLGPDPTAPASGARHDAGSFIDPDGNS